MGWVIICDILLNEIGRLIWSGRFMGKFNFLYCLLEYFL